MSCFTVLLRKVANQFIYLSIIVFFFYEFYRKKQRFYRFIVTVPDVLAAQFMTLMQRLIKTS